jgi:hypothetical protein
MLACTPDFIDNDLFTSSGSFNSLKEESKTFLDGETKGLPRRVAIFSRMAHCVVSSRSPYRIISVSSDFTALVDLREPELLGRSFAILYGPETDTRLVHGAMKALDTDPQNDVHLTLYTRTGDRRQCAASFAAALDCDGHAIGCQISLRPSVDPPETTPPAPPPTRLLGPDSIIRFRGPGLDRRRHNLYVGLLLESEAKHAAEADARAAAMRHAEEALLCQLLAAVCV